MSTPRTIARSFVPMLTLASIGFMAIAWFIRALPTDNIPNERLKTSTLVLHEMQETSSMRNFTSVVSAGGAGTGPVSGEIPANIQTLVETQVLEKVRKIDPEKLGEGEWFSRCPTGYYVHPDYESDNTFAWHYELFEKQNCQQNLMANILVSKADKHISVQRQGQKEVPLDVYLASLK